jgi:hypothetical protein
MHILQEGWNIWKPKLGYLMRLELFLETNDVSILQLSRMWTGGRGNK